MKVILKTREELLRGVFEENPRATHWRIFHPRFAGSKDQNWGVQRGRLSCHQIENMAGKEVFIEKYFKVNRDRYIDGKYVNKMIPMLQVRCVAESGNDIRACLPTNAFKGFKVSEWNKANKFKRLKTQIAGKNVELSLDKSRIRVQYKTVETKNFVEELKTIMDGLGYKVTKRRK